MACVRFPPQLRRHFPIPAECSVEAGNVAELVTRLDQQYPGLAAYLVHEDGSLRKHVNIFVDERFIRDRRALSDAISPDAMVHVMQALSGG